MPKKKGGKKKGGKKGKKKAQNEDEKLAMIKKTKEFLKLYTSTCSKEESSSGAQVVNSLKRCIEEEKPLVKAILDLQKAGSFKLTTDGSVGSKKKGTSAASSAMTVSDAISTLSTMSSAPVVQLKPLLYCLKELKYDYIRCLHLWYLSLTEEDLVSLALFMACPVGRQIRVLDLVGANVTMWGIQRLSRTFLTSQLVHLTLDYNRLTSESVVVICQNLRDCLSLISLNMNYCHLTAECGEPLGLLVSATQLRHLGLQGNNLQSNGVQSFLSCLVAVTEVNEAMPLLERVILQDNAIDGCGVGELGVYAPVLCMQVMGRWLAKSKNVGEIRLEGNLIGDTAARELLQSLQQRKEAGLPSISLGLTNKICADVFSGLMDITGAKGGRKKGKGKKKGKKKK